VNHRLAHLEALMNAILGIGLSQLVLACFGIELRQAIASNTVMIGVSYARAYALRRLFARHSARHHAALLEGMEEPGGSLATHVPPPSSEGAGRAP
jgi:hypothetical protein